MRFLVMVHYSYSIIFVKYFNIGCYLAMLSLLNTVLALYLITIIALCSGVVSDTILEDKVKKEEILIIRRE